MERLENGLCDTKIELVILDKFGYFLFSPYDGALLFHFLTKPYECRDYVITPQISFSEQAQVLLDTKMTTAMHEQLTHCCYILDPSYDRYRIQNRSETAKKTKNKAAKITKAKFALQN